MKMMTLTDKEYEIVRDIYLVVKQHLKRELKQKPIKDSSISDQFKGMKGVTVVKY